MNHVEHSNFIIHHQPVREAVSYRGLFTAGWFDVREKYCFRLEIYDRLRANEQAAYIARQGNADAVLLIINRIKALLSLKARVHFYLPPFYCTTN